MLDQEFATVDAGHLEAPRITVEDMDGDPRVRDGNLAGVATPDTRADER